MEYKKFDSRYVVRLEKGEEVVASLTELCKKEGVQLASVEGLGAVDRLIAGVFDTQQKEFLANEFSGKLEILSLSGTMTTLHGEVYPHLHIAVADETGRAFGGHLKEARVSATAEILLNAINGRVERLFSDEIGLNLLHFVEE